MTTSNRMSDPGATITCMAQRYRVNVRPDGLTHFVLHAPELDGYHTANTRRCDDLTNVEDDAAELVASILGVDPDTVEIDLRCDTSERAVEVCRDRVYRAAAIRGQIGDLWAEYIDRFPRRFTVRPGDAPDTWTLKLYTREPMPARLSTLFGEWLYELRASLDGILYVLAVRDSGQNPPPAERGLMFPTFDNPAKFDDPRHRGRLQAVSDETFELLRHVQPFNAQPDHLSNMLWWLDELARIDRHRYGHALAPHIDRVRVGLHVPLTLVEHHMPEPFAAVVVDETEPLPIITVRAPEGWDITDVQQHLDITEAANSFLDVPEWRARASKPMNRMSLDERMRRCEEFVLLGIVDPLAAGDIDLTPPSGDTSA